MMPARIFPLPYDRRCNRPCDYANAVPFFRLCYNADMTKPTREDFIQEPQAHNSDNILLHVMELITALSPGVKLHQWEIRDIVLDALLEMATMTHDRTSDLWVEPFDAMVSAWETHIKKKQCTDSHIDRSIPQFRELVTKNRMPSWIEALQKRNAKKRKKH